jgi:protein-S-isoprenylcysteine O-methyltransferase Ste14
MTFKREENFMKRLRDFIGYLLGGILFVCLIPTIMWLASGMPALWPIDTWRCVVAPVVMLVGLVLSVWTIVYMRSRGKGNPMDAFGHEVAPRTKHLMVEGPYKINRNPMLTGTLIYLAGVAVWLWTWQAVVVLVAFFAIMMVQVLSEEKRLRRDFGEEYEEYCKHSRRF